MTSTHSVIGDHKLLVWAVAAAYAFFVVMCVGLPVAL